MTIHSHLDANCNSPVRLGNAALCFLLSLLQIQTWRGFHGPHICFCCGALGSGAVFPRYGVWSGVHGQNRRLTTIPASLIAGHSLGSDDAAP